MNPRLPDKIYFKIGEVSEIVGVEAYVLRYWETEFDLLKPSKAPSRHRLYKKKDVELLLEIKRLLYAEGFTIEGARKRLKESRKEEKGQLKLPLADQKYKNALVKLKKISNPYEKLCHSCAQCADAAADLGSAPIVRINKFAAQ